MECQYKIAHGYLRAIARRRIGLSRVCLSLIGLSLLLGCGKQEYDERYKETAAQARAAEPFLQLWKEETELGDGQLTLRLPQLFNKSRVSHALDDASPEPRDAEQPLDQYRVQPYFLELPGHLRTYERILPYEEFDEKGQSRGRTYNWPLYGIMAVLDEEMVRELLADQPAASAEKSETEDASDDTAKQVRDRLYRQLLDAFGKRRSAQPRGAADQVKNLQVGVDKEWKQLSLPTPHGTGERIEWHRLGAVGEQAFHVYGSGDEQDVAKPKFYRGQVFLYHTVLPVEDSDIDGGTEEDVSATRHVVLMFRAPLVLARKHQLARQANAVAGTVRVHAPPPAEEEPEPSED